MFDEGGEARYAMIDGTRMMPQPERIVLLAGNGELDAEGAASDSRFAYVTGSHSRKRDPCVANPDSRNVYRLALQSDGRVQPSPPPVNDQGRLWRLMSASPVLGPFVDKCLGKDGHGINIEGLAVRNDQLYFGFREPAQDRTAYILRVAAGALFEGGDLAPRLFTLEAGKASGIRDLLAVPEGLLVLVGPDDDFEEGCPLVDRLLGWQRWQRRHHAAAARGTGIARGQRRRLPEGDQAGGDGSARRRPGFPPRTDPVGRDVRRRAAGVPHPQVTCRAPDLVSPGMCGHSVFRRSLVCLESIRMSGVFTPRRLERGGQNYRLPASQRTASHHGTDARNLGCERPKTSTLFAPRNRSGLVPPPPPRRGWPQAIAPFARRILDRSHTPLPCSTSWLDGRPVREASIDERGAPVSASTIYRDMPHCGY